MPKLPRISCSSVEEHPNKKLEYHRMVNYSCRQNLEFFFLSLHVMLVKTLTYHLEICDLTLITINCFNLLLVNTYCFFVLSQSSSFRFPIHSHSFLSISKEKPIPNMVSLVAKEERTGKLHYFSCFVWIFSVNLLIGLRCYFALNIIVVWLLQKGKPTYCCWLFSSDNLS